MRSAGLMLLAAALLAATGCFEVEHEVIDAYSAVAVSGLPGTYTKESGGSMTISAVPHSNDYRFRSLSKDNKVSTGYIRLILLRGTIYIVQAKYDSESVYYLLFYEITRDASGLHYREVVPKISLEEQEQLAKRYGVTIEWDDIFFESDILVGSSSNIMAFLRAHVNYQFSPPEY